MILHLEAGTCGSGADLEMINQLAFECYQAEHFRSENPSDVASFALVSPQSILLFTVRHENPGFGIVLINIKFCFWPSMLSLLLKNKV